MTRPTIATPAISVIINIPSKIFDASNPTVLASAAFSATLIIIGSLLSSNERVLANANPTSLSKMITTNDTKAHEPLMSHSRSSSL